MKTPMTRVADCQCLPASQINHTPGNFADPDEAFGIR